MHVLFILLLNQIFEIYDRINKISFVSLDKEPIYKGARALGCQSAVARTVKEKT